MQPLPDVSEHYFTGGPATAAERRPLRVELRGHAVEVEVAGGVFSPTRLDLGTSVLLRRVPSPPNGADVNLLDIGCGWGPITIALALAAPEATIWAVDASERALDLTRRNAERLGLPNVRACLPEQVPPAVRFEAAWSNPPIRVGKSTLHEILASWLPRLEAVREQDSSGAWLVVQRNLGADSLARWIEADLGQPVTRHGSSKGFRVLHVAAA
ncbi:MAG: class I SAM-dependent methyltransferase [Promicromonosporaceae bacterium]|nr:class I SAM-dependent methyltransferase [Promicromonosporaceae bacterium]